MYIAFFMWQTTITMAEKVKAGERNIFSLVCVPWECGLPTHIHSVEQFNEGALPPLFWLQGQDSLRMSGGG